MKRLTFADVAACLPKGDALTRSALFALVATYGFVDDKAWARWAGVAGLLIQGVHVLQRLENARRAPEVLAPAPAAQPQIAERGEVIDTTCEDEACEVAN